MRIPTLCSSYERFIEMLKAEVTGVKSTTCFNIIIPFESHRFSRTPLESHTVLGQEPTDREIAPALVLSLNFSYQAKRTESRSSSESKALSFWKIESIT